MNTNHYLVQQLEILRREFAQYRVETALQLDKLNRRVDETERALERAGFVPVQAASLPVPLRRIEDDSIIYGLSGQHLQVHALGADSTSSRSAPSFHRQTPDRATIPGEYAQLPRFAKSQQKTPRSGENAQYLPFALEKIALVSQKKGRSDRRTCNCGRPTFDIQCFREHHFDWCLIHQRPVVRDRHCSGSRHGHDCQRITWEKPDNWDIIVKSSFDSGHLGVTKVQDLHQVLFPTEVYPDKYQGGWFVG